MSQYNDTGCKAFECDEALPQYSRVTLNADGKVTVAGLADIAIGTATRPTFNAGEMVAVRLFGRTHKMIAVEAFAAGAVLYGEASGKVQDTAQATAFPLGLALEAANADGDVVEVMDYTVPVAAS